MSKITPTRFADQTELRNWLSSVVRLEYNSIENRYKFPSNDLHDLLVVMNTRHEPLTGLVCELVDKLTNAEIALSQYGDSELLYDIRTILTKAKAVTNKDSV